MTTHEPDPAIVLTQQAQRMLAFWRDATEHLDQDSIVILEAERQNLLHALQIGLDFPQTWPDTAGILDQAFPFSEQRGYWQEWKPLLQRCLQCSDEWPPATRVALMSRLGQTYRLDQQLDRAVAVHLEAEKIAQTAGQDELMARVQYDLLEDYLFTRKYAKAIEAGQAATQLFEKTGTADNLLANCHKMMGTVLHDMGESETAEGHLRMAVTLWRSLDDSLFLARALNDLARPLIRRSKYDEAEACLTEAASLLEPTIYELDKCIIHINLGSLYAAQQEWLPAEAAFHRANSPYLRQSVNLPRKARIHNNLGFILFQQSRYEEAEEHLRQSLQLWEEAQDPLEAANTLSTLADCLAARGQTDTALPLYDRVIETASQFPQNARARSLVKEYEAVREQMKNSQPA
jgi:tetratricopeptide (TPR) repeat protein